jgi:ectoine hydroxylase-related dioxygenase (phytanoyl-CoA dioxygenase family)
MSSSDADREETEAGTGGRVGDLGFARRHALGNCARTFWPGDLEEISKALEDPGVCVVKDVLPCAVVDGLAQVLEQIRAQEWRSVHAKTGHQRVLDIAVKHRGFSALLEHPLMLAVWRRYLGSDMVCSTWSANVIFPDAGEVYWHCDHPYWTIDEPYVVSIPLTGQAIWMLDDFKEESGATAFVPNSHRIPHLPRLGSSWTDDAVFACGSRGSVILAAGALWHTSTANRSKKQRAALLARYARGFIVTQEDMVGQLNEIANPSDNLVQLLGGKRYRPQRGFPY